MFINPTRRTNASYNKPIYGLTGQFTLSQGITLPYFSCNLEINRAVDELKVAEQVPASLGHKWSLNELFQREINQKRIEQEIVRGYLLDPRKIKFFNAITIVLMPKDPERGILPSFDDIVSPETPPIPYEGDDRQDATWGEHPEAEIINFGGVQFVRIGTSARLRWDEDKVLPVAVDGQHRLWALRTFREDPNYRGGTLKLYEQATTLPVIFVLLDAAVGFRNDQSNTSYTIREIARELFTDLNKNAKPVDKARELVLDDRSIIARCVRTLLTQSTGEDSRELLPLSLIRWQDDQNRFDTDYYLNSLVHLELVAREMLDLDEPNDPMDRAQVENYIKSINDSLGVEGEVKYDGKPLSVYYAQDYCDEDGNPTVPFARLPQQYLNSAIEGFTVKFQPWMLRLLLDFKPYRELLDYARERNLVAGTFGSFFSQTRKHREAIKREENNVDLNWFTREIEEPQQHIAGMKEDQWAYKAIFQKAMVRLGKVVEFQFGGNDRMLGNVTDLLNFLDRLYDQRVLLQKAELPDGGGYLWTYIALNASNQKIKVARAVENRIFNLLRLWYYGTRKLEVGDNHGAETESPGKLLKYFSVASNRVRYPDCNRAYENVYEGFNNATFFNAVFGRDAEKAGEQKRDRAIKTRFVEVFAAGLPAFNWHREEDTQVEIAGQDAAEGERPEQLSAEE